MWVMHIHVNKKSFLLTTITIMPTVPQDLHIDKCILSGAFRNEFKTKNYIKLAALELLLTLPLSIKLDMMDQVL